MRLFRPNRALIEVCLPNWPVLTHSDRSIAEADVAAFLDKEFAMLPWFMAAPLIGLQSLFFVAAFFISGATVFERQDIKEKNRFINLWCRCGLPFQAFIRLYRSLILLAFMEHASVRSALGLPNYVAHQKTFRARRDTLLREKGVL